MSCGISVPFGTLSPTRRQVTHVLLTRLPLNCPLRGNRVRLACVRHAASVDSEPGSNSHVKFAGPFHNVRLKPDTTYGAQLFNARTDDLALALFRTCDRWFYPPSPCAFALSFGKQPPADTRRAPTSLSRLAPFELIGLRSGVASR